MPPRRIGPLWALLIGFVVLMASNAWLGQSDEAHWNEEARALIAGIILHTVVHEPMSRATLATVRDKLTRDPAGFAALLADMQASTGAHGLIARAANRHLGKSDREATGVLSSAQRHTHFLDSPRIVDSTSASDFRFADLKQRPGTVFLCLPPDRLDTYARWLRLLVSQAVTDMARSLPGRNARSCSCSGVRRARPPRSGRARDGADSGLRDAALADPPRHAPAQGDLWRAGRHVHVQRRSHSDVRGQRSCRRRHAVAHDRRHHHRI